MEEIYLDLLKKAIDQFGELPQMDQAIEEAAEFIVAVQHYKRKRNDGGPVAEEIIDLKIVANQMLILCELVEKDLIQVDSDNKLILERLLNEKMARLNHRLQSGKWEISKR